ncbi:argininosuccinate lyase [Candidatus Vidania fulgoroideorum]
MKWSKRFSKPMSSIFKKYTFSISRDIRLLKEEKKSIISHVHMLNKIKIIKNFEKKKIIKNIIKIKKKDINKKMEDIHFALENELEKKIGKLSSKIRIARSRNDLSTNCLKMWVLKKNKAIIKILKKIIRILLCISIKNYNTIIPAFTHSQIAQPITLGHYLLAFCEMFLRDIKRTKAINNINDFMPLGSCAVSGTIIKTNRDVIRKKLYYKNICRNSLDGVSDRDYVLDSMYCYSQIIIHISRLCEDFIIWSNKIYDFIDISDSYCSGSSLMPQKKNPDVFEVSRSKTGVIIGNLFSMFLIIKALPMGYNKDCQEDKKNLFESYDNIKNTLIIFKKIIKNINFKKKNMLKKSKLDFSNSTDISEFLSNCGISFKKSHSYVSESVLKSLVNKKSLINNVLKIIKKKHNKKKFYYIKNKIKFFNNIKNVIYMKNSIGSTNPILVLKECKIMFRNLKNI